MAITPLFKNNARFHPPLSTFRSHFSNTANSWDDVRGPNDKALIIGRVELSYTRKNKDTCNDGTMKFVGDIGSPPPREVKAAIHLLLRLQLFGNEMEEEGTTDSLMREIAQGRKTEQEKNTKQIDTNCAKAFVDMLTYNLTLNDFNQRAVPPKNMDEDLKKKCTELFTHNHKILVQYLRSTNETLFDELAKVYGGGTIFNGRRSISQILQTRRDS